MLLELQSILDGFMGGARYGVKIRLPHAAVMTALFRDGSPAEKLRLILKAAFQHSRNLAYFAAVYKSVLYALKILSFKLRHLDTDEKRIRFVDFGRRIVLFLVDGPRTTKVCNYSWQPGFPGKTQHAAIAGAVGGYLVWGKYTAINHQIVLYLIPRIIEASISLLREKKVAPFHLAVFSFDKVYPIKASIVWGVVMALFEYKPNLLHPSLKHSMNEIYRYGQQDEYSHNPNKT